ncbi:MAG: hypothetical protein A2234_10530 [Elusimicrobia bacterium RIFOXYA2_FULL_58_8]|nr:MAG: hypothetical protein A2234_10530 [Elusimicrobia bacterium RIFOXYA2_FULL_58_8]
MTIIPEIKSDRAAWPDLLHSRQRAVLEKILPAYIRQRRWFGGKAYKIRGVKISSVLPTGENSMPLVLINVGYTNRRPQIYILPLAWRPCPAADRIPAAWPGAAIAWLELSGKRGLLYDATHDKVFHAALLALFFKKHGPSAAREGLTAEQPEGPGRAALLKTARVRASRIITAEQSNTSIVYGSAFFAKLFRRLEKGINPDTEIGRRLTAGADFRAIPPFMGAIYLNRGGRFYGVVGLLQGYLPNRGDSWKYAAGQLAGYYERVLAGLPKGAPAPAAPDIFSFGPAPVPYAISRLIGAGCFEKISLLGRRTAQMHLALSRAGTDPDFCPEPFTRGSQRAAHRAMAALAAGTLRLLERRFRVLPAAARPAAALVLKNKPILMKVLQGLAAHKISAMKIRTHGDLHLGQVLFTGRDFVMIDFEGEPSRSLAERRLKNSALRDVAGMLRSFHYAAWAPVYIKGTAAAGQIKAVAPWAELWYSWISYVFLQAYFETCAGSVFIPRDRAQAAALLRVFLIEKAIYELSYELNNRPHWVRIPLQGLLRLLS